VVEVRSTRILNYHAVPGNIDSLQSFRAQVVWHWSRAATAEPEESDALGACRTACRSVDPECFDSAPSRPALRFNARYLR